MSALPQLALANLHETERRAFLSSAIDQQVNRDLSGGPLQPPAGSQQLLKAIPLSPNLFRNAAQQIPPNRARTDLALALELLPGSVSLTRDAYVR